MMREDTFVLIDGVFYNVRNIVSVYSYAESPGITYIETINHNARNCDEVEKDVYQVMNVLRKAGYDVIE